MEAPKQYKCDDKTRFRLRESFATLLRDRNPALTPKDASLVTSVSLRIVMGLAQEYGRVKEGERERLVEEFTSALIAYLRNIV